MSELWDAPNKQAVGLDPPWVEGTGGSGGEVTPQEGATKAELLARAQEMGASPANNAMTKAELEASIAAREAELAQETG
jgi:hypothetical protein